MFFISLCCNLWNDSRNFVSIKASIELTGQLILHNSPNVYPGYDTKQSNGEARVMLELWRMHSTPSLPLLPGPLYPGMVTTDRVLSWAQIELLNI